MTVSTVSEKIVAFVSIALKAGSPVLLLLLHSLSLSRLFCLEIFWR